MEDCLCVIVCVSILSSTKLLSPVITVHWVLGLFFSFFSFFASLLAVAAMPGASRAETPVHLIASLISPEQGHHKGRKTVEEKRQFRGHLNNL